jgi:general secretion pathway protein H
MGRAAKVAAGARGTARGFTLLELIVTLAVLALAAAVVTPAVGRGTEALPARAEVAGFAATLRHVRERAINTQRPHRVSVDVDARQVVIEAAQTTEEEKATRETRALPSRVTLDPVRSVPEVTFDARGMASGADFKLTAGGIVYHVTVDRLTGRVRSTRE